MLYFLYLLGYLFVFLRPLCYFFKGSELYFCHTLILHCTVVLVYKIKNNDDFIIFKIYPDLRANVCNFRESVDSHEFFNFFIFCPHNLYSTLISKITLKLVTAFYFFLNRAKFEKRQFGALSSMKLAKINHFLRART